MSTITLSNPLPGDAPQSTAPAKSGDASDRGTYSHILKSTALVGGSSIVNILVRIARGKVMALLLGPAGVGLVGLYGSISDLTQSIAGVGINSSGVRQIAEAAGSGDSERIGRTASVLRRTSVSLGIVGALLLVLFSRQVALLTFGNDQHTGSVCLLSFAVLLRLVSDGQGALIQGLRRISDLAKIGVVSAVFGAISSLVLVFFLRENGVVPSIVAAGAISTGASWWFTRKLELRRPSMSIAQVAEEASSLLKLGFTFMASSMMMMGAAYAIRLIVLRKVGFEATGLYQSAWILGGLYVGFILQAMGADFYPRLTASAADNVACNRMVNEQTRVGLLLAGPGTIATLTLAPIVITLLYSSKFSGAVEILRWICLGATLQVVTWPMGFIILAKGKRQIFFLSELAWTIVNISLAWLCVEYFGLNGSGIAFFGSYLFHAVMIYPIVWRVSGFCWSEENKKTGLLYLAAVTLVFCGFYFLPALYAGLLGITALILSGAHSIRVLLTLVSTDRLPSFIRALLVTLRFLPRSANSLGACR